MVDAQDLTQAFFARIIETRGFASADRARGRFRSYLLGAMKHFLANEWHRAKTQKRGGQVRFIEWDALDPEGRYTSHAQTPAPSDNPDLLFDREWASETTASALQALREEMAKAGKNKQFDLLKGSLTGQEVPPREQIATRLGMSEGAVKVAVHRLRKRYRMLLKTAIAETVSDEGEIEDEMRYLIEVCGGGEVFLGAGPWPERSDISHGGTKARRKRKLKAAPLWLREKKRIRPKAAFGFICNLRAYFQLELERKPSSRSTHDFQHFRKGSVPTLWEDASGG